MIKIFKNFILAGLGAISITKEKAEKLAAELIKRGKVSEKEGEKVVKDLIEIAEKGKQAFEAKINKTIDSILRKRGVPTKREFEELKKKIGALSKKE